MIFVRITNVLNNEQINAKSIRLACKQWKELNESSVRNSLINKDKSVYKNFLIEKIKMIQK